MTDPDYIDTSRLRPGPIRHETLSPELLEEIRIVYKVVRAFLGTTLEQFEIGFMRDMHPEEEVAVWRRIAAAWLAYQEKCLGQPEVDEKKLIGALIAISTGIEDVEALGVPVDVGRRLMDCYDGLSDS